MCCKRQNIVKNTYCPMCGNNLSGQFFNEEMQKSKDIIAYEKEKLQLINYCLTESQTSQIKTIIANRYHYIKNKYNKIEYKKI